MKSRTIKTFLLAAMFLLPANETALAQCLSASANLECPAAALSDALSHLLNIVDQLPRTSGASLQEIHLSKTLSQHSPPVSGIELFYERSGIAVIMTIAASVAFMILCFVASKTSVNAAFSRKIKKRAISQQETEELLPPFEFDGTEGDANETYLAFIASRREC